MGNCGGSSAAETDVDDASRGRQATSRRLHEEKQAHRMHSSLARTLQFVAAATSGDIDKMKSMMKRPLPERKAAAVLDDRHNTAALIAALDDRGGASGGHLPRASGPGESKGSVGSDGGAGAAGSATGGAAERATSPSVASSATSRSRAVSPANGPLAEDGDVEVAIQRPHKTAEDGGEPIDLKSAVNTRGLHALHCAAREGHCEAAGLLLDAGVKVDVRDDVTGATALHHAAFRSLVPMVRLLLFNDASVRARDDRGREPLHAAVGHGNVEVVDVFMEFLRDDPAVIDAIDDAGHNILHLAAKEAHGAGAAKIERLREKWLTSRHFDLLRSAVDFEGHSPVDVASSLEVRQKLVPKTHLAGDDR